MNASLFTDFIVFIHIAFFFCSKVCFDNIENSQLHRKDLSGGEEFCSLLHLIKLYLTLDSWINHNHISVQQWNNSFQLDQVLNTYTQTQASWDDEERLVFQMDYTALEYFIHLNETNAWDWR